MSNEQIDGSRTHLRGFASMSSERRKAIASKGGKAAHARGTAHQWDQDEARVAGRKGGRALHAKKRAAAKSEAA